MARKSPAKVLRAKNPHKYGAGTRLSSAYTHGRNGLPVPRYTADKTSAGYKAWKRGRDERALAERGA